ncbi:peptidylprolyl isomerase [Pseudomarimonas salicorniae]|uniref:peptidylprolyl isomerase n=1 Tax=Pseudomarimonas salicorniae TaxID=2933270 RepID=A0ABT0GMH1_9GAMM|nr:peptidyl-prolyl cis-trans isomerase [Lysobacter sp. CAU 1642]MCK7595212.1 peptidyl-prolyl cis-trans isomerase [Lysobacter sp. CAU 1642]
MKKFAVLLLPLMLAACAPAEEEGADPKAALIGAPDGPLVAMVNGEAITEPLLVTFAKGRGLDPALPAQRKQALDTLIENVLLAQEAAATGLLDKPEVQAEAALVRVQQVAGRMVSTHRAGLKVEDAQLQALYEQEKQRAGDTEFRVQHILLGEESEARAVLERAQAPGADFEALMKEYAAGLARQARELPWSNATQLPEPLVEALRQMQDGEIAPVPVESQYGWHVLRRAESRPFSPPPIESVREGATRQIIEQAMREFVAGLRAKAEITTAAGTPAAGN